MEFQTYAALVFFAVLSLVLYKNRKRVELQKIIFPLLYFAMYRTKLGLKAMDWLASKFRTPLKYLANFGIVIGFMGMALITFELVKNVFTMLTQPEAISGVGIVQPFVPNVPGTIFVPFFYFIISIFIIAVVHEFSHGVIARVHNIKLKSSGFAFLAVFVPIIPAAFVEPDEKVLEKRPISQQLAVFAAGPFSNIILAFIILGSFAWLGAPLIESMVDFEGIQIVKFAEGETPYPAEAVGMELGEIILSIDGIPLSDISNFSSMLGLHSPGDTVSIKTDKKDYTVTLTANPTNESSGYLGVSAKPKVKIKPAFAEKYGMFTANAVLWVLGLLYWLFLLNLGIGLFNLVPLGPIDGGRMFKTAMEKIFNKKIGSKIWVYVSFFVLSSIVLNLVLGIFA